MSTRSSQRITLKVLSSRSSSSSTSATRRRSASSASGCWTTSRSSCSDHEHGRMVDHDDLDDDDDDDDDDDGDDDDDEVHVYMIVSLSLSLSLPLSLFLALPLSLSVFPLLSTPTSLLHFSCAPDHGPAPVQAELHGDLPSDHARRHLRDRQKHPRRQNQHSCEQRSVPTASPLRPRPSLHYP